MSSQTVFGSLNNYEKGGVQIIDDDPKHYCFSNVFEVASKSRPYEKVAVGQNLKYVIEALRAEGNSPWFAADHDEAALVMDGEVEVHLIQPDQPLVPAGKEGSVRLAAEPKGKPMGWILARRGHMALLPKRRGLPVPREETRGSVVADDQRRRTVEKWAEICQTAA